MFKPQSLVCLGILAALSSCQNAPPASVPTPFASLTPSPQASAEPVKPVNQQGIQLSEALTQQILQPFGAKLANTKQIESTIRFKITRLPKNSSEGQIQTSWEYSSKQLQEHKGPLTLATSFLQAGDAYAFEISYISEKMGCERLWGSDRHSIYPGQGPLSAQLTDSYAESDELGINIGDITPMDYPVEVHGRVLLPDGKPAANFRVDIGQSSVYTNTEGYYISQQVSQQLRDQRIDSDGNLILKPAIKIAVQALSDLAEFKSYEGLATVDFTPRSQCDESLSRHDIQLQAK